MWNTPRDPKRIKKVCELLENAWSRCPDQRLGQFLLNYVFGSIGRDSHIYHKEDDLIQSLLEEYIKKFDAFEELPEVEKRKQRELYRERILKDD